MSNPWKRLESRRVYENPWIRVYEDQVVNPAGGRGLYGVVRFRNRALGIVPVDERGHTWLVGQFRYALDAFSWEIPMGGGALDRDPLDEARRELREETGIRAKQWQDILRLHTSNCVTDEEAIVWLATDLEFGPTDFDETEQLELRELPLAAAVDMVVRGEITDAVTVAGLLRAAQLIGRG